MQGLFTTWNMFFFSSFISRYLQLSIFGLFTMWENRTGEIKYYVNYTNVYLEGKEVADWGNVFYVCILCPEQGVLSFPLSKQFRTPTAEDSSYPLSTYVNIDDSRVLKFTMPISFVLRAVKAIKNWWGGGTTWKWVSHVQFHVFRNKVRSGRHF